MPSIFTDRRGGIGLAPYESFNLGLHVGDKEDLVLNNRAILSKRVGRVQFMNQSHSDQLVIVRDEVATDPNCDALITTTPGLAIAVLVADCIPLLLSSAQVVAAVHVGRKGIVNKIASKVIQQMRELGATSINAILGPSICGKCYEVSACMADEVLITNPEAFSTTREGRPALDLPKALVADLRREEITYMRSSVCTFEDINYFSYRRENITGRTAGVIWL